jgi:hypothetical protein
MNLSCCGFQVFAEVGIKLGDSETRNLLIFGLRMLLEEEDEFFSFHIIERDIDILRLPAHDLVEGRITLSRTHPPATLRTVLSCNSRV